MAGEQARLVAGRYRLGERIGRGGMGVVWAARDELLARPVAVKEVWLPGAVDPAERDLLRERTLREARTAARLDHPCAVRVFDVCEEDEQAFLVMELIEDPGARPEPAKLRRMLQSVAADPAARIPLPPREGGGPAATRTGGHTVAIRPATGLG